MFSHLSVLKYYFTPSFFPVDPFHVVNSLLSHSNCYFLNPLISRSLYNNNNNNNNNNNSNNNNNFY